MQELPVFPMAATRGTQLIVALLALMAIAQGRAEAGLLFTVLNSTADGLSFSISGSFDTNTAGESPGFLALKNDWSNNVGIHTELFSVLPIVTLNTISIGGLAPTTTVQNGSSTWMDDVFFENPLGTETPILAGTTVSGSLTLSAVGAFNPANLATLELVSGFNRPAGHDDWARSETGASVSTVPEASSFGLFSLGIGLMSAAARRHRRQRPSVAV